MSLSTQLPLLVIGAGSIGERHIEILQSLGYQNIHVYRQRMLPLRTIPPGSIHCFTEFPEIDLIKPYAAIICTPTAQHLAQALECVKRGIHVLVEKPLSVTAEGLETLKEAANQTNSLVQVAYMLRYHPLMQRLKALITDQRFGHLLSFSTYWGEYLPNWHPWEDYRTSYAAKRELGGGVALTLSHDLDIVSWLVGELPLRWQRSYNYRSELEVDVESGASFLLDYANGVTGVVQLNYYQKIPKRTYELVFDKAFVTFDYFQNTITIQTVDDTETIKEPQFERNEMFRRQTVDFLHNTTQNSRRSLTEAYLRESEVIVNICR